MGFTVQELKDFSLVRDVTKETSLRFLLIPFPAHMFIEKFLEGLKTQGLLEGVEIYCTPVQNTIYQLVREMEFHGVIALKNDSSQRHVLSAMESEDDVLKLARAAAEKRNLKTAPVLVLRQFYHDDSDFKNFFEDLASYRAGQEVPDRYTVEDGELVSV